MRITPRAEEVEHVVEALQQDHATAAAAAKAAMKATAEILEFRQLWAVIWERSSLFGPFASQNEAEKFAATYLKGWTAVTPMGSVAAVDANAHGAPFDKDGWCKTPGCRHPTYEHMLDARGHCKGKCTQCPCQKVK